VRVAVLGFRPHTGWTAAAAITGVSGGADVIDRRRIEFSFKGEERFIYHRVEERPHSDAAASIAKAREATQASAARMIKDWIGELNSKGFRASMAAVPMARTQPSTNVDEILAAHSRIHAAEGAFYRDVIAAACSELGLEVHRVVEREIPTLAAAIMPSGERGLDALLRDMGKRLGPPWSEDQKIAVLAAWLQLDRARRAAKRTRS
jgi:hypothetical protein